MNRLKELRKEKKYTQAQIAELMDVNVKTISRWEKGEFEIKPAQAKMLADFFGVSAAYLLGLTDNKNLEMAVKFNDDINGAIYVSAKQLVSFNEQQKQLIREQIKKTKHYIKKIEEIKAKGIKKHKDIDLGGNLKAIQILLDNVDKLITEVILNGLWKKENDALTKDDIQILRELEDVFHMTTTNFQDGEALIEEEFFNTPTDND
ncbi:helix-turn-helix domain-containing protein [Streptococcus lutetiensis]|uniref:helix-turn-helix domain-containing protein n=1 Tax=Streptococcus lutetiensis TaxID=150055 RepID=UPI001BDA2756|nr:helix-turn-helix domain-containing protein [Streptococcus lutetiensis]MBT0933422.1 helix-turn-helix domain-containing protein [Streptococcus lutetiensis]MBT0942208.1 helix-turn-helix domain-containing protein [Streptococcus lutetiensis]